MTKLRECPFCRGEAEKFGDINNWGIRCSNRDVLQDI